jgi:N6-L-threonylcarbamoyladenine synthase
MRLLTIESSCDETAAAVVQDGVTVLSNIISSQEAVHAPFGGVVPELASRKHLEVISSVIEEALSRASQSLDAIDGIAVTQGPGLAGALLVGISVAKAIAYARNLPLVGIHHIEGHLFAVLLEKTVAFPFIALVVSGGHTHLYRVDGYGRYRTLGQTRDDAAGEAFDKVAKILGLPYPGGSVIDRLASRGDPDGVRLPRPLLRDGSCNFSFSGLKTAVVVAIRDRALDADTRADVAQAFEDAVVETLAIKCGRALEATGAQTLVVAGGVGANRRLRARIRALGEGRGVRVVYPRPEFCTDNAAMIALTGCMRLEEGQHDDLAVRARARWPISELGPPTKGREASAPRQGG